MAFTILGRYFAYANDKNRTYGTYGSYYKYIYEEYKYMKEEGSKKRHIPVCS